MTSVKTKINIAIDGYSSCGKSTIAKSLAKELNYVYIDSGAMYRAVALYALQHNLIQPSGAVDEAALEKVLDMVLINFRFNTETGQNETHLNGINVEKEIRTLQVSNHVSRIAGMRAVRQKLVKIQKRITEGKGVVMDGRDIGTVVMPDAELKFFMVADARVRAQRRFDELRSYGSDVQFEDVLRNVSSRDEYDSSRAHDPLRMAPDAIIINNTALTLDEQFDFVMNHVKRKMEDVSNVV
jgi:cytidylate kinase